MDEDPKLLKQAKAELSWFKSDLDGSDGEKAGAGRLAPSTPQSPKAP